MGTVGRFAAEGGLLAGDPQAGELRRKDSRGNARCRGHASAEADRGQLARRPDARKLGQHTGARRSGSARGAGNAKRLRRGVRRLIAGVPAQHVRGRIAYAVDRIAQTVRQRQPAVIDPVHGS